MSEGRRTFGPVVLVGVAGSALATLAATRAWFLPPVVQDVPAPAGLAEGSQVPLAVSLALVCLAAWGTLVVTRGRLRRAVAAVGLVGASGLLATWVWAWRSVPAGLREELAGFGVTDGDTRVSGWYWIAGGSAVLALAGSVAALRLVPAWPEMGERYDAPSRPAAAPGSATPPAAGDLTGTTPASSLDLWKSLDEGHDPTTGPD